jgi:hypothetical protein
VSECVYVRKTYMTKWKCNISKTEREREREREREVGETKLKQ